MGCVVSDEFDEPLSEDLENEMNIVGYTKQDEEVDRFESNKPEEGFVIMILFRMTSLPPQMNLKNSLWLLNHGLVLLSLPLKVICLLI